MSYLFREMAHLRHLFEEAGQPRDQIEANIQRFWAWDRNREQPFERIAAYMFAGLAAQVQAGRKKAVSPGFVNDVRAVAAYAPFVDAMFVDNECATILGQGRIRDELEYRARIFSLNSKYSFLDYLREIETQASEEVRLCAGLMYGSL